MSDGGWLAGECDAIIREEGIIPLLGNNVPVLLSDNEASQTPARADDANTSDGSNRERVGQQQEVLDTSHGRAGHHNHVSHDDRGSLSSSPEGDYVFPGDLPQSLSQYLEQEIDIEVGDMHRGGC